jgi:hypothetical protein
VSNENKSEEFFIKKGLQILEDAPRDKFCWHVNANNKAILSTHYGLLALGKDLIPLKRLIYLTTNMLKAVLTPIGTEVLERYDLFHFKNPPILLHTVECVQALLTPHGLQALELGLIKPIDIVNIPYRKLRLLLTDDGMELLKQRNNKSLVAIADEMAKKIWEAAHNANVD